MASMVRKRTKLAAVASLVATGFLASMAVSPMTMAAQRVPPLTVAFDYGSPVDFAR